MVPAHRFSPWLGRELEELFEICDRIYVISNGMLSASQDRRAVNVEDIGLLMTNVRASTAAEEGTLAV